MTTAPDDWWRTFFTGMAIESWLRVTPPELTRQEADFLVASLQVAPPARLLDVPCGGGRHCQALADLGFDMTGVDISPDSLEAAKAASPQRPGTTTWELREMRDLPWPGAFHGAYSFGNSFGYLDDAGNAAFLQAVAHALRPGARFVLDTSYVAETLLPVLQERAWYKISDILMLAERRYDPIEGRLHVEYLYIREGVTDRRGMSARIHTCREVIRLLEEAGFHDVEVYGSLAKEPFRLGSNRLLVVATRS